MSIVDEERVGAVKCTDRSADPLYREPYIIVNEHRDGAVQHRYVHGGFKGTPARFSFYFPSAEQYQGRFHHNTYPLADSADVGPFPIEFQVATGDIGFTIASGAYYVQTNNGGAFALGSADPSVAAYRANAAAAKYSRVVAAELYGDHRPFGYLYGGSGGAYQAIGAAEQTSGIWDGFMPFVTGCNFATPSNFTVRLHALRVLRRRNKLPAIMDAVDAGGSGDMYAGLNDEERSALMEVTLMGFPPGGWYSHEEMDAGYFSNLAGSIPRFDPTYAEDFWTKPGYLGTDPSSSLATERFQFDTTVSVVGESETRSIELAALPSRSTDNCHLVLLEGPEAGNSLPIKSVNGKVITFTTTAEQALVDAFKAGVKIRIDNSWPLALETYHRHQLPPGDDYYGWNQFRDETGAPIYPQRQILVGEPFTVSSAGALLSGNVQAKTLLVQAHMDVDSFAWFADWYRSLVRQAIGPDFEDRFALWFVERAQHENPMTALAAANAVSAAGALQQGLRDLSRWVEEGVRPSDTHYDVVASQIELPARASERCGPQPVVDLRANGGVRAEVSVGQAVNFVGMIEAPPGAGKIVSAEWDFEGHGKFALKHDFMEPSDKVECTSDFVYSILGTYFAVLRGSLQREGEVHSPYATIKNLARVRIVVT